MTLHIYLEGRNDRCVKSANKETVVYYIRAPYKVSSTPPKEVYRGRPDQAPHIATITGDGGRCVLEFPGLVEVIVNPPAGGIFNTKSTFTVNGKEYAWKSDAELREVELGALLAKFDRKIFSTAKKGVLTISSAGFEMVDIVVLTGIAMQYQWEQMRDSH